MMKKIEIVETFGKYRKGQVVTLDDFGVGHALAFKYGRIYVDKPIETQSVLQPETRVIEPVTIIEPENVDTYKKSFFKRRGRKKSVSNL